MIIAYEAAILITIQEPWTKTKKNTKSISEKSAITVTAVIVADYSIQD